MVVLRIKSCKTLAVCGQALSLWNIAVGSLVIRGNTCDCRMPWTYRWTVKVVRNTTRCPRVVSDGYLYLHTGGWGHVPFYNVGDIEAFTYAPTYSHTAIVNPWTEEGFVAEANTIAIPSCLWSMTVKSKTHNKRRGSNPPSIYARKWCRRLRNFIMNLSLLHE